MDNRQRTVKEQHPYCKFHFFLSLLSACSYLSGGLQREEWKLHQTWRVCVSINNCKCWNMCWLLGKEHIWAQRQLLSCGRPGLFFTQLLHSAASQFMRNKSTFIIRGSTWAEIFPYDSLSEAEVHVSVSVRALSSQHHSLSSPLPMFPPCHCPISLTSVDNSHTHTLTHSLWFFIFALFLGTNPPFPPLKPFQIKVKSFRYQ